MNRGEIDVRSIGVDDWPLWRCLRLEALGEAPYAFGATLAQWQGQGDTEVRWRARLCAVQVNLVAHLSGKCAGMVSGTGADREGAIELISMWVAPFARGRGVGDALVAAAIEWARGQRAVRIALDVTESNQYAIALYHRHDFVDMGRIDCTDSYAAAERRMVLELQT